MSGRNDLIVEILAEEIPAWMLEERLSVLHSKLVELFSIYENQPVDGDRIHCDATSRRLWFHVAALSDRQPDRREEVKGPPESIAFKNDEATKALDGFLRKNQASADQAVRRDGYVWLERTVEGRSLGEFMATDLPPVIEAIRWPRMMRWGTGELSFIRPVHGLIAIHGETSLDIEMFGIRSSTLTAGHRTRGAKAVEIESAAAWEEALRAENVVVRVAERVERLQETARKLASEVGGEPAEDAGIWRQWSFLTEYPGLVRSEFDEEYLELPEEVLVTVMRVHQKQLPIHQQGRLTRHFLSIVDAESDPEGFASSGNAFVTNARFADALFFMQVDLKRDLAERVADLEHLQFQETLGDYASKTRRITAVAEAIHAAASSSVSIEDVREACTLSKADLVTEMVKEFTDLQGQVGGIYARRQQRPENVWQAIYDQYLPQSLDDELPRSESGAIVSLADRIDTLAGFFLIGLKPTGSRDPFALRRAAQGIVRILFNESPWRISISIETLIDIALDAYGSEIEGDRDATRNALQEFISDRVSTVLENSFGFAYDEIAAAMAPRWSNSLPDLRKRTAALHEARRSSDFLSILDSAKRISNIVPEGFSGSVREELTEHDAEKRLARLAAAVRSQISELIAAGSYDRALGSFASMADELEAFFDDVMVNVDDDEVRTNRLSILQLVGERSPRSAMSRKSSLTGKRWTAGADARCRGGRDLARPHRPAQVAAEQLGRQRFYGRHKMGLLLRRRESRRRPIDEESTRRKGRRPRRDDQHRRARSSGIHDHHRSVRRVLPQRQNPSRQPQGGGRSKPGQAREGSRPEARRP